MDATEHSATARAKALVFDHDITKLVGSKHENPGEAARLIAEAIRAAEEAMRERCAALAESRIRHAGTKDDPCDERDEALELLAFDIRELK